MKLFRYWSNALRKPGKAYNTMQRECISVVQSSLHLRPYLQLSRLTIRTDYNLLQSILNMIKVIEHLTRWHLPLMVLDFKVVHQASFRYQAVNSLTRLSRTRMHETLHGDDEPILVTSKGLLKQGNTGTDPTIWHCFCYSDGIDLVKPTLPEVLKLLDPLL